MAMFPCDVDKRRYAGPQRTLYPAVVHGSTSYRRKLRVCRDHYDEAHDKLIRGAKNAQQDFTEPELTDCYLCHQEVRDSEWMLFVTAYDRGVDREDWWAPLHEGCAMAAADDWYLATDVDF